MAVKFSTMAVRSLALASALCVGACGGAESESTPTPGATPPPTAAAEAPPAAPPPRPRPSLPEGWTEETREIAGRTWSFYAPPDAQVEVTDDEVQLRGIRPGWTAGIRALEEGQTAAQYVETISVDPDLAQREETDWGIEIVTDERPLADRAVKYFTYNSIDGVGRSACWASFVGTGAPEREQLVRTVCDSVR